MSKLYWLRVQHLILVSAFLFFTISSWGQKGQAVQEGLVRIKVSETLAATLERSPILRTAEGVVITGVASLDDFNRQFKVTRFRRLFRAAGKFEARHRRHGLHRWYEIRIESPIPVLQAVSAYQSLIQIEKAEPVHKKAIVGSELPGFGPMVVAEPLSSAAALNGPSNDPMLARQWHYNNTGQTGGTPGADIRLFDAWQRHTGKQEVVVAVTDGGIQLDHPDLKANLWVNAGEVAGNNIDDDDNGFVDDVHGYSFVDDTGAIVADDHGTHVAGTIAAVTHNGIGVAGVAGGSGGGDGVRLMSCAVFGDFSADGFPESYIYAADNGAVISQNSWGYISPGVYELAVLEAIDYFIAEAGQNETGAQTGPMKGGLVVFSAGNSNSQGKHYPGYYAPTFAVASTTHRNGKAWYSNYGTWVDISAPGGETDNVDAEGVLSTLSGSQYGFFQGTSMACPHVSGAAALVISKYGRQGFSPEAVRERLRLTASLLDTGNSAYNGLMGSGLLNAGAALRDNDQTAPAAIADLSIVGSDIGMETLSWTVPADQGGFVASYDIRYSKAPITASNFSFASAVSDPPAAAPAGSKQQFTVTGLSGGTLYYFAMKAIDFEGNRSSISNVISKTTVQAPVIDIVPASLTEDLQTAQSSTRTFTVRNTGPGPLKFRLANAVVENDFAACSPAQGNLAPGGSQVITVKFNAADLLAGTYRKDLRVESNDPERSLLIVALILRVTNNNAPIASVTPDSIHFNSVQIGTSVARKITLHNAGSDPLVISKAETGSAEFATNFSGSLSISAFRDADITITFSPSTAGLKNETVTLHTNDATRPTLKVAVAGEGLNEAPVAVTPGSIEETIEQGTTSQRALVLKNNGSFDRTFRIEVVSKGLQPGSAVQEQAIGKSSNARVKSPDDYQARPAPDPTKVDALLLSQPGPVRAGTPATNAGRQRNDANTSAFSMLERYATGFEDFETGSVNDQEGWYASEGWDVETVGPDRGEKHLRGTAVVAGQTTLAISPTLAPDDMPEESPQFTTVSMRVNFDNMEGAAWQIVPQDHWSYVVTRIRINEDRTIDVMSVDENYDIHWNRIDAEIPSGYFDLAVEHNGYGDGSSGFPTFDLYLNNQKVFTGYNIGSSLNEVAFICTASTAGPTLDIDELDLHIGEHIPVHITASPVSGVLPAGSSATIALNIDGTAMRFGTYRSDIVAHIDETSQLTVPAVVAITGEGSATTTSRIHATGYPDELIAMDLAVRNTGGAPFNYKLLFDLPGLSATPASGYIPVRDAESIVLQYDPSVSGPGIFYDTLRVVTDLEGDITLHVPVFIRVWEELSNFSAPTQIHMQVQQGEIATAIIQMSNSGQKKVHFENYMYDNNAVTVEPQRGVITAGQMQEVVVTLDGTQLSEGWGHRQGYFMTNDPANNFHFFTINFDVLPATANGSGRITREEWAGVTGKTVASIPVNTPPTSVTELTSLEGAYGYGDNYGVRIRGYIQPPYSGEYTFWIASDDHSELWLSTDMDPANKMKIAYLNNYVDRGQYEKYPSQKSMLIDMEAGRKYYIEVLHKEGTGRDHLTVGWQIPGGRQEFPVSGVRLFPLNFTEPENSKPVVTIISPEAGADFAAPASVEIAAEVSDDGDVVKVEFYNGSQKLGADASAPYSFRWNDVAAGSYAIVVKATDNLGAMDSAMVNIEVRGQQCAGTGTIRREVWTGISGTTVSVIPVGTPPASVEQLSMFESPSNAGDNYGSRIRGYLCVPSTGAYTFWIASDDHSELWLSTDESPSNRMKIASVTGHTQRRQWEKYPTQRSAAITLQAGHKYYVEALHKEGTGTDHLAVGWQLPGGALERPIAGNRLLPFEEVVVPPCAGTGTLYWDFWPAITGTSVSSIPVDTPPALVTEITSFETPQYFENNYGARLRGYICVPQTGAYTFWIASDDNSELWLSTDTDRANRARIASVAGSTRPRQWDKYPSQRSLTINLVAGSRYYIEALHKEANGNDHVAVAWQLPDGTFEGPIPGSRLSPGIDAAAAARSANNELLEGASEARDAIGEIVLYPNPAERGFVTLSFPADADRRYAGAWQVEITSMTGTVIHSEVAACEAGCSAITLGINERFTPGIYMVNVIVDRKRFSKKLVVH